MLQYKRVFNLLDGFLKFLSFNIQQCKRHKVHHILFITKANKLV
jgi:hypothetical protein